MHTQDHFDVVLSFDLVAAGCLAWRVGKQLNIPAAGWAIGNDLRVRQHSSLSQLLLRALVNLNLVFYQSQELLHIAQSRLIAGNLSVHQNRHVVLSRGVPLPPHSPPLRASRYRIRAALQIERDEIAVVNIGRVVKAKGVFDLVDSISLARAANHNIICMIVGSKPEFDDTDELNKRIAKEPRLRESIRILPSCPPDKVWEYLTAADIFAFTSHAEGMPNSILEAMSIGLASIAFGIPPILELDNGSRSLIIVPPFDIQAYAQAILNLASSLQDRTAIGDRARRRVIADFNIQHKMAEALRYLKALTPSNCGEI
jgi:glycosyltransferase involved in cell wall biosynthesis